MRLRDAVKGPILPEHESLTVSRAGGHIARLHGEGERFCPNVGRRHGQSSLYCVVVDFTRLALRCHCKKGSCSSFQGDAWQLSQSGAKFFNIDVTEVNGMPPGFA